MLRRGAIIAFVSLITLVGSACGRKVINVEKELVDKVIAEFTEERLAHYLKGGEPKSNAIILEKVLQRHSLRLIEFRPAFRRFRPEIESQILGNTAG